MNNYIDINKRKKEIEAYDQEHRDSIISRLNYLNEEYTKLIDQIELNVKVLEHSQHQVNNIAITINNKLVEIANEFRRVGLSLYSQYHEDMDLVSNSFIGDAIIADLISKLMEANERIKEYSEELFGMGMKIHKEFTSYQTNIFKKIFILLNPFVHLNFSLSTEQHQKLDALLKKYADIEEEVWNYHYEDYLVDNLVKSIICTQDYGDGTITYKYTALDVPLLVAECITPCLTKLGLEGLIPKLKQALINTYKEKTNIDNVPEEDMYLYIPDFDRPIDDERDITIEEYTQLTDEISQKQELTYDEAAERQYRSELIEAIIAEMKKNDLYPLDVEDILREKLENQTINDLETIFYTLEKQNYENESKEKTRVRKKRNK